MKTSHRKNHEGTVHPFQQQLQEEVIVSMQPHHQHRHDGGPSPRQHQPHQDKNNNHDGRYHHR